MPEPGADSVGRRLRVLWLIRGLGPGGAEHLLVSAAKVHDHSSFSFEAAYLVPWKDALVPALAEQGVPATCLGVRSPADPRWLARLGALLRHGRYDIVHVHSPVVGGLARPLLRVLPTPRRRPGIVYTEHNRWTGYKPGTRLLNRATFGLADAHLAVSKDTWSTISPRHRDRVDVIVQGIVGEEIARLRSQRAAVRVGLGLADAQVAVVTVANLRPQKAYPDLLEAARLVLAADPNVVWLAIGQGPLEADLRKLARELGLGERFRFLGHQPEAARVVAGCDIFALASWYEGYPIAVMEALALGLPVVATDVGGIPDAIHSEVEGLVVPPRRPDLLGAAVLRLCGDKELRRRLGAAALDRGAKYDIADSARETEAIYRRVALSREKGSARSG